MSTGAPVSDLLTLKCGCCGIERTFVDGEAAFHAGWDAPPYFTQVVCCDLCPAVVLLELGTHEKAHKYWDEHGRPEEFDMNCFTDERWGDTKMWDEIQKMRKGEV